MTFTSSSTVRNFVDLVRGAEGLGAAALDNLDYYSIGPITSAIARDEGLVLAAEASEYTVAGLVEAIVQHRAARAERK